MLNAINPSFAAKFRVKMPADMPNSQLEQQLGAKRVEVTGVKDMEGHSLVLTDNDLQEPGKSATINRYSNNPDQMKQDSLSVIDFTA